MKIIIAIIALGAGLCSALAAPNPPPDTNAVVAVKKPVWDSMIVAGLTLTRGNSDTELFTAKFTTQKKKERNEWLFGADAAYGENDSVSSADSWHGVAQFNHLFSEQAYGYANADALHDGIQDLQYRVSLSPGAGYYVIKTKPTVLAFEVGPGFISERRGEDEETYLSLRLAEHCDQKLSATSKCWEKVEILPEAAKFDNYAANMEIGVESAITKSLSLQVTLDDDYVNEPAAGHKNNDVKLVSGIAYKF